MIVSFVALVVRDTTGSNRPQTATSSAFLAPAPSNESAVTKLVPSFQPWNSNPSQVGLGSSTSSFVL